METKASDAALNLGDSAHELYLSRKLANESLLATSSAVAAATPMC